MGSTVPVLKDEDRAHPVPTAWRARIEAIVTALADGRYSLEGIPDVEPPDARTAAGIAGNVEDYGGTLIALPAESWDTSISQWQGNRWQVLVDLFTLEEGRSDLVLHLDVLEQDAGYLFRVHFVYVP